MHDTDHLKHLNYNYSKSLVDLYEPKKNIYVYNDCINSLYSLFRRNFQWPQIKKLTNNKNQLPDKVKTVADYVKYTEKDLFEFVKLFKFYVH